MMRLLRMQLRRDRIQLPIWIVVTALLWFASAGAIESEFDADHRDALLATVLANPAIIALRGLPDGAQTDALVFFQIFAFIGVVVGLMNTFLITRHTRADEERGRLELVGATPVTRTASLRAVLLLGVAADVVLAAGCWLAQLANGFDPVGALLSGLAVGAVGLAFLGIGAIAAQVMPTSRSANGLSVVLVLAAYLLRGIGDALGEAHLDTLTMTAAWPSWLSPIGWAENISPYREQNVAPLLLLVALFVVASAAALALQSRRDLGDSLVPERLGRATASGYLASSTALAWRLHWSSVIAWAVGGAAFGAIAGSLGGALEDAVAGNAGLSNILENLASSGPAPDITDTFTVAVAAMAGLLAAAAAVQAVLRMRSEEADGRAELLLSTPVSRPGWLLGSVLVAAVSGVAVALSMGLVAAVFFAGAGTDADAARVGPAILAGLAQLPTVAVYIGIAALAVAVVPRAAVGIAWGALALGYLIGPIGGILGLDDAVRDISPFQHTPIVPGPDPDWGPAMIVLVLGVVLAAAATAAMRRRQITT